MDMNITDMVKGIELCLLPKLQKNFDEATNHPEFETRMKNLDDYLDVVIQLLATLDFKDNVVLATSIASSLVILYQELKSDSAWNTAKAKEYSSKLNSEFEFWYNISLDNVLKKNTVFNNQDVFDKCMENLHRKLEPTDIKKFPGRIDVYCSLVENIENYGVTLNPLKILPMSQLLMDDYMICNKLSGLKCYKAVLKLMAVDTFQDGNYYEVMYKTLMKNIHEKNLQMTKLVLECSFALINILPLNEKKSKSTEMFANILEQLLTETSVPRKIAGLKFINKLIDILKIDCIKHKKKVFTITSDNLDMCCSEPVGEELLLEVIECLEVWTKYCWCVWNFTLDQHLLSLLLKVLYVYKKQEIATRVQNLTIAIICCFKKEEQRAVVQSLNKSSQIQNEEYQKRIDFIKMKCIEK